MASFTVLANNGEDTDSKVKPVTKAPSTNVAEFPNPILKLWNFFIGDYNKFKNKHFKKTESDTTIQYTRRYLQK
jgi:hypothetical protein